MTGSDISILISFLALVISIWLPLAQIKRTKKQQFETSFFNLLSAIRELVNNIKGDIRLNDDTRDEWNNRNFYDLHGLEYFRALNRELRLRINAAILKEIQIADIEPLADNKQRELFKARVLKAYNGFFNDHISELALYFRFIYNVTSFIETAAYISSEEKRTYMNFIQAQMIPEELALMFYNGLSTNGKKFHPILDNNSFLENIHPGDTDGSVYILHRDYPRTSFRFINLKEPRKIIEVIEDIHIAAQVDLDD